ncbi:MAG: choice-of-anchor L domain-containing protein [Myxococcales bacterium]|nr:choice-of-anchor L domain-containing protein [Myxococcales bacterium]
MEVVTAQGGGTEAPADEDCDGLVDEPAPTCDAGLDLNSVDAWDAARALDICQTAGNGASWGLVSAAYVRADGTPAQPGANVGLLATFGDNLVPHSGERMLGLSSGHARDVYDVEGCGGNSCSTTGAGVPPAGFPQAVPGCGEPPTQMRDDIALEVALRAPSNASGYAFDFVFFSFEYPEFVCTPFNDQFVVVATPPPANAINGNIVFDNAANPVSVNLGFFGHCDPLTIEDWAKICNVLSNTQCPPSPSPYCPFGAALLTGTGFDVWGPSAGSTGWFGTTAPVEPGELVTLRFAIWDSSDSSLDSTVVADHFRWLATPASLGTAPIPE